MMAAFMFACAPGSRSSAPRMERIVVSIDQTHFALHPSGTPFVPWGFNYDHDEAGRLIEDYWDREWEKVASDFREMKDLGANVVRVHLQFGRFMESEQRPNRKSLRQLRRLVKLAEEIQLYVDLTGLACYHKADVPSWYDALSEERRWAAQATFWNAVARECAQSPSIFCYDLMNEPVSPAGDAKDTEWLGPPFAGKHFVQRIGLQQRGRPRPGIARAWTRHLASAIRKVDPDHLITVGLVDWSLDRPGLTSGFVPEQIAPEVDFVSVHLYPEAGKVGEAISTLRGFAVGKPVLIEETFPLKSGPQDFADFIQQSKDIASGWIGFYWGRTPEEYRASKEFGDQLMLGWLEFFQQHRPTN
jgi:hypothetical protein